MRATWKLKICLNFNMLNWFYIRFRNHLHCYWQLAVEISYCKQQQVTGQISFPVTHSNFFGVWPQAVWAPVTSVVWWVWRHWLHWTQNLFLSIWDGVRGPLWSALLQVFLFWFFLSAWWTKHVLRRLPLFYEFLFSYTDASLNYSCVGIMISCWLPLILWVMVEIG